MFKSLNLLGCLALFAALMIALPAHAERGSSPPPASYSQSSTQGAWSEPAPGVVQAGAERADLEAEHDRIKEQCNNAKGQDRTACMGRINALRDKMQSMHESRMEMHENKMEHHARHDGDAKKHKGEWKAKHNMKKPAPGTPPAKAPAKKKPATPPADSTDQ